MILEPNHSAFLWARSGPFGRNLESVVGWDRKAVPTIAEVRRVDDSAIDNEVVRREL